MPVAFTRKYRPGVRRKFGPWSHPSTLALLDGRCQVARDIKELSEELAEQLGGAPSPAERLLIKSAAVKVAKIGMLIDKVLTNAEPDLDLASRCFLAWSNSLRRDLEAIGLKAPAQKVPSVASFVAAQKKVRAA